MRGAGSRQEILEALTAQPKVMSLADKLRLTRSPTFDNRDYTLASVQPLPAIDLEIYFDFNSAAITSVAEPQLDGLGAALTDPRLKGATISIGGHTDGVGGDAFNKKLSERRAAMIKEYLGTTSGCPPRTCAPSATARRGRRTRWTRAHRENRRVEVVNLAPQATAQR